MRCKSVLSVMICHCSAMDKKTGLALQVLFLQRGVLACGEDTQHLRLTSELVDLRCAYANPILLRKKSVLSMLSLRQQEKHPLMGAFLVVFD